MNYKLPIKKNRNAGYTIIETMISISVFLVVVMAGMGALLSANLIHEKSTHMRSIMDNLSFIMEDISRNLRTGYNYHCWDEELTPTSVDISIPKSCEGGGWGVAFEHQNGVLYDDETTNDYRDGDQWVYYVGADKRIYKSTNGAASFIPLTPREVEIDTVSGFVVAGAESGDDLQPFTTIRLLGTIRLKGVETPFSLQTAASQRLIDI